MKKHFYAHLVDIESLIVKLDELDLEESYRHELAKLVDSNLHHTILDAVLSELSEHDKEIFLKHLKEDDHSKIWEHLNNKVDNIEEKIKKAAEDVKRQLHKDIEEARKK